MVDDGFKHVIRQLVIEPFRRRSLSPVMTPLLAQCTTTNIARAYPLGADSRFSSSRVSDSKLEVVHVQRCTVSPKQTPDVLQVIILEFAVRILAICFVHLQPCQPPVLISMLDISRPSHQTHRRPALDPVPQALPS